MAHRQRGAMLPVWGAYVVSCIALGACAYQQWLEPVAAKINFERAKVERETARILHDKEQMANETSKRYERMSYNMGYNRVKPGVGE